MNPSTGIPIAQYIRPLQVPVPYTMTPMSSITPIGIGLRASAPDDDFYPLPPRHHRKATPRSRESYRDYRRDHRDHRDRNYRYRDRPSRKDYDNYEESSFQTSRKVNKTDRYAVSGSSDDTHKTKPRISYDEDRTHLPQDDMPPDPPKKPVDVKRKTMTSPTGEVTYITEMLYDVDDSEHPPTRVTRPPNQPMPFIPPSTEVIYPSTNDPRLQMRSTTDFPLLPLPPIPFRTETSHPHHKPSSELRSDGSDRRESNDRNLVYSSQSVVTKQTTRPMFGFRATPSSKVPERNREKTWKENTGLGAAAIAGIVIGSLVSITLLAGTSNHFLLKCYIDPFPLFSNFTGTALFVMYRSPFGSGRTQFSPSHHDGGRSPRVRTISSGGSSEIPHATHLSHPKVRTILYHLSTRNIKANSLDAGKLVSLFKGPSMASTETEKSRTCTHYMS